MRLGILISGRGSNFEAISNSIARRKLDAEIAVVISNRASAPGLEIARERGIPMRVIASAGMDRETYDRLLIEELRTHQADLICLAGFMRLLSADFVRAFPNRVLNIHPSLLPAFPGLDAQRQALEHGVKISGCTVHLVDEFLDSGPIVIQSAVPVLDEDTVETLSERILSQEHLIYSKAIQYFAEDRVVIEGRRIKIREAPPSALLPKGTA
ncbi:MAG TPA: phosphoribosylglycinamide formyltransferase [Bryobacteraceae bacterium]|jgi:phosphoribosylglycinamide formyltransferase-1|nr:phosphoribosylglycinamide formyltransferase [Bryobacteraceae bacterium]